MDVPPIQPIPGLYRIDRSGDRPGERGKEKDRKPKDSETEGLPAEAPVHVHFDGETHRLDLLA